MKKKSELLKKEKMMKKMSLFCALTLFMLMSRSFTKEISSCGGDNLILDAIQKKMEENAWVFHIKMIGRKKHKRINFYQSGRSLGRFFLVSETSSSS